MKYIDFKDKVAIKALAEKWCHFYKEKERFDSLKGALEIEQVAEVEKLLKDSHIFYSGIEHEKTEFEEAVSYCIGKAIVVITSDIKSIIQVISLKNFDIGKEDFKKFQRSMNTEHENTIVRGEEEKKRLDTLIEEFKNLGKSKKIEKGKILEEIDSILSKNKELGSKGDMWKNLGISNSDKSMLCKRYKLFKEFQDNGSFSDDKEWVEAIEGMTDIYLKNIAKEGLSMEEKENMILSLI